MRSTEAGMRSDGSSARVAVTTTGSSTSCAAARATTRSASGTVRSRVVMAGALECRSPGPLAQPRQVVSERTDVGVGRAVEGRRHDRVAAGAAVVAVGEHRLDEIVLALPGEARDLRSSAVVGQMTAPAMVLLREREPLLHLRRVRGP